MGKCHATLRGEEDDIFPYLLYSYIRLLKRACVCAKMLSLEWGNLQAFIKLSIKITFSCIQHNAAGVANYVCVFVLLNVHIKNFVNVKLFGFNLGNTDT